MSWVEKSQEPLVIVTGDGKEYKPLWKASQKVIEYNVAQFEFPGVKGSFVSRGTSKGRKFPLEIYFTGPDHIDQTDVFEASAEDKRHWIVTHPYYGVFNAKPASINVDDTQHNISKISINLIEHIVEQNPKGVQNPSDKVLADGDLLATTVNRNTTADLASPTVGDKNLMLANVTKIYNEGSKKVKNGIDAQKYFDAFNKANAAILNITDDVSQAMTTIQAMINAPFQFIDSVKNRVAMLKGQFNKLIGSVANVTSLFVKRTEKRIYEHNAALIVATIAQSVVTPTDDLGLDYLSVDDVLLRVEELLEVYNDYIETLDLLQSDNGGDEDAFIPDPEVQSQLNDIVNFTAARLMEIALESKQERSIVLEYDSNVVVLAHRFYGLVDDDSTIDYLISTNGFGGNDLILIEAGRKVKYYV